METTNAATALHTANSRPYHHPSPPLCPPHWQWSDGCAQCLLHKTQSVPWLPDGPRHAPLHTRRPYHSSHIDALIPAYSLAYDAATYTVFSSSFLLLCVSPPTPPAHTTGRRVAPTSHNSSVLVRCLTAASLVPSRHPCPQMGGLVRLTSTSLRSVRSRCKRRASRSASRTSLSASRSSLGNDSTRFIAAISSIDSSF